MEQPMWFHCDQKLHYEAATRNPSTQNVGTILIRSLQDFFREGDTWPTKEDFVTNYYNDEELSTTDMAEEKLLSRLYYEVTQILQRIHSTNGVITWITPTTSGRSFYVGVKTKERKHYFTSIPRSQLSRIVRKPPEPAKSHPVSTHWSSRERSDALDSERVRTFMATSRHLRKRGLPIYEDLQFRLGFRMLPVRSRFWFLKDIQADIILCRQPSCGAVESDQHLFLECDHTAQLWREILPSWDQFFSSRTRWTHIACAIVPTLRSDWKDYFDIISDLWPALQAVTLHFVWTDRNRRLFDHQSATPTVPALSVIYTTFSAHVRYFRRQCYDHEERIRLAKVLDQLETQGSFGGFFRSRKSSLRVRHRQVKMQVQLGS